MLGWALGAWLFAVPMTWAQSSEVELTQLSVEPRDAGLYLTAQLKLELGLAVEDALLKGLAVHFVAEAELMRDRWYWYDRKLSTATRHYRLAYQPLTRRWRLNVAPGPVSGMNLAGSIAQSFETLPEALDVIRRQSSWKIADMSAVDTEARQYIVYRFKLDISQLPRPFQIAAGSQSDWTWVVTRPLRLALEPGR